MTPEELRIALFTGNYNYVRDGANQALNRLVGYLLRQGAAVRVYAPQVANPAFEATGEVVDVPAVAIPTRREYRIPVRFSSRLRRDLAAFAPNVLHIASPDPVARSAVRWARARGIPAVASVHTRFETYLRYYRLQWLEPAMRAWMRRLYRRCDAIMAPAASTAAILRAQRMNDDIVLWTRGVDREQFHPGRRSLQWRRERGIADDSLLVAFLGRVVMEKALDVFAAAIAEARRRDPRIRVLVIGQGPARPWFAEQLPADSLFTGELVGEALATALASADVLLNPSVTEAFGNVTLEAMACALPVVAAAASGTTSLVEHGRTGLLVEPGDGPGFGAALADYAADPALRARHGKAGLAYARTMDWDEVNAAVMRLYERVIARHAR